MDSRCHEFVCEDCKADVFSFGGPSDETRCAGCELVRSLNLSPVRDAALRVILGCEIPPESVG
jgi:hypothetical protein